MPETEPAPTFEDAVAQLEAIVAALESGTLPLDESLRRFEQAVALSRHCAAQLEQAEQRIQVLTADEGFQPLRMEPGWGSALEGPGAPGPDR